MRRDYSMIKKTVFIVVLMFFSDLLYSQSDWKQMTWPTYGIDFMVPGNFKMIENTTDIFVAEGDGFSFAIQPWRDSTLTVEQVAAKALEQLNADDAEITARDKIDLNGFEGYEIIGAGQQEGEAVLFIVLGFIDPVSDLNYSAYIMFWHDPKTDDENIKIAKQIVEGVRKTNE